MKELMDSLEQMLLKLKIQELKDIVEKDDFFCDVDRAMAQSDLARLEFLRDTTAEFGSEPAVFLSSMERIFALYTETAAVAILSSDEEGTKVVQENADKLVTLMSALLKAVTSSLIKDDTKATRAVALTSKHIEREEGRFKAALVNLLDEKIKRKNDTLH